jgi:hypothetical protein
MSNRIQKGGCFEFNEATLAHTKIVQGKVYQCIRTRDDMVWFIDDEGKEDYHYQSVLTEVNPTKEEPMGFVESTGGSSSYYELIVDGHNIETHDVIQDVFGNDFDFGNMFKALVRIWASVMGKGKQGTSIEYDLNKIIYTCEKLKERYKISDSLKGNDNG